MRKGTRIALQVLGGLVGLILLVVVGSYFISGARLRKQYDVRGTIVAIPRDSASLTRGKALATLYGCTGCHTPNLGGMTMIDQFPFARLASANITRGDGGIAASYTDADWDRAIRHGVRQDGTPLFIMPSHEFNRISDDELGRLLAYLKTVPPVDRTPAPRTVYPLARVLHTFGAPLVPAEKIDHETQANPQPAPGATLVYGEYVAGACKFCHAENLGGQQVGGEPGAPPSPPIGPSSAAARWSDEQFIQTMRTGTTPDGRKLRPQYMPWEAVGQLRDDELRGLHMYLKQPVSQAKAGT
jgi:mono/diheme cytochrome c family protein